MVALIGYSIFSIISLHFPGSLGIIGDAVSKLYFGLFSQSGYFVPYILFAILYLYLNPKFKKSRTHYVLALISLFFAILITDTLFKTDGFTRALKGMDINFFSFEGLMKSIDFGYVHKSGGLFGDVIVQSLMALVSKAGVFIVAAMLYALTFVFGTNMTLADIIPSLKKLKKNKKKKKKTTSKTSDKSKSKQKPTPKAKKRVADDVKQSMETEEVQHFIELMKKWDDDDYQLDTDEGAFSSKEDQEQAKAEPEKKVKKKAKKPESKKVEEAIVEPMVEEAPLEETLTIKPEPIEVAKEEVIQPVKKLKDSDIDDKTKEEVTAQIIQGTQMEVEFYQLPSIDLLTEGKSSSNASSRQAYYEKARVLTETLKNFKVDMKITGVTQGPTVTMFEGEMSPGTKISKIVGLSADIALSLAVPHVRIAPIPGKSAIGIEVPNKEVSMVTLRDCIDSDAFKDAESKISIALGQNIQGETIVGNLQKMPHLLIAGATGSGKSVCVNTIIASILYKAKPDEVKFLMIDPKVVELNTYNGIPHLILPVVTDPKKASVALNWAVQEMLRRYESFAEHMVRDITSYNVKAKEENLEFFPQIVIIIDELADLMMAAPNAVEDAICRLAQMARAAGMHLIVATQRPSVDVITGIIKANIPSRIAFTVSSSTDSRVILDMVGAESLLGRGDMLFYPTGAARPQRVQGGFISDQEVERVVKYVREQSPQVEYNETILEESIVENDFGADELLKDVIEFVIQEEKASTSFVQRKFRIGYNRAARMIDEMEERNIIGPSNGSKPREVLITATEWEMMTRGESESSDEQV